MKMIRYTYLVLLLLLVGCLAKPKQPELVKEELELFEYIKKESGSTWVERELYPICADEDNKSFYDPEYSLDIHLSCDKLDDEDKLAKLTKQIAPKIELLIFSPDFKYNYRQQWNFISVRYFCYPAIGLEKSVSFEIKNGKVYRGDILVKD
jgi:hypothetical protein